MDLLTLGYLLIYHYWRPCSLDYKSVLHKEVELAIKMCHFHLKTFWKDLTQSMP